MRKGFDFTGVCVTCWCHDGNGRVLFNFRTSECRDEKNKWDCGGGGVKFGELIEDAVDREIKEEYLVDAIEKEFLGFREVHRDGEDGRTHWISFDYKIRVDPGQAGNGEPNKHSDVRWFEEHEIPEHTHSQVPYFMKLYEGRLF